MAETRLIIKTYKDGVNDSLFPSANNTAEIVEFSYSSQRMGVVTLSATLMHSECLDNEWTGKQYIEFNNEKYFIKGIPTSAKDSSDVRYKHDLEFVSQRTILDNVYFYDVVSSTPESDKFASNSTKVVFMGDVHEFVARLNRSLQYSSMPYNVVIDEGIVTEAKLMSFEDQFFSNVLQEIYNVFELPYYFNGTTIHIGYTNNAITHVFKYGIENSLVSVSKNNANYKIVNRCTGVGSGNNIPFYYPNLSNDRAAIEASGGTWITPTQTLMPPIYRETKGSDRFYNAINGNYTIPNTDPAEYYVFENEYSERNPREHKVSFEDIQPTIVGITNANNQRIDLIDAVAFDTNDSDEVDDQGNYKHPYFFVRLKRFDGSFGFNLFDHAIVGNDMTLSMTSGNCAACNFTIGVDTDTMKNTVQVDSNGALVRDKDGNVVISGKPQDRQNDTYNYNVWIALKKDIDTFGTVLPSVDYNYKPGTGDSFVLLHIDLPQAYVDRAENELKEAIIKYMSENNSHKFTFSINFSRIFLAENPNIADQLNENARLLVEYNGMQYPLYVSSYNYRKNAGEVLPEITVELADTITVNRNALQTSIDAVRTDLLGRLYSFDILKQGLKYFLRKDVTDRASALLYFDGGLVSSGIKAPKYSSLDYLYRSIGWNINEQGDLDANSAILRKSLTVPQIIFDTIKAVGGKFWFTDTHTISKVTRSGSTYLCELDLQPNEHCTWDKDDCLTGIMHTTNTDGSFGGFQTVECLVISVENNIATLAPRVEALPPSVGLVLNRCGNITNVKRQSSVFLSAEMGGTITLVDMNSWTIGRNNIGAATGDLSKLASIISMPELNGMSMLAKNVVLYGKYYQIDDITGDYHPVPNLKGDWERDRAYSYYDEVTHLGRRFLCIDENGNTGSEPFKGSAIWLCTVDKGEDGDKWNYCDKWDPAQEYKRGDVVLYGRDTYMYQWHEPSKGYYPDAAEYYPVSIKDTVVRVMNTQGVYVDLAVKTQRNRVWALMSKGGLDGDAAFSKQYSPDKVIIHNEYIEGDVWSRDKVNTGDWSIWYRIKGESANEPNFMFKYSATKPTLPSATASIADMMKAGWSDVPPSPRPEGQNLYQVYAKFNEYGNIIASWSEPYSPDGKDGVNGESILVQYAIAQNSNDWHFPFRDGDEWERQSIDGGKTWTEAWRCVGETGNDGAYVENQYIKHDSWTTPPSQSASGWQDAPFATVESGKFIWKRERKVVPPNPAGSWGAPYVVSGQKGQDGTNGKDGINGANGVNGNDGTSIVFKGAYASHPSNPQNGWCYYNTVDKKSYVYQSGHWYQMTVDGVDGINGTNGSDGLSIEYKGEMANPPANPKKNWAYRDTDNGMVYIYNGSSWVLMVADGTDGSDGLNGKDGLSVFITYHDNAIGSKPSKPTGNGTTGGWHTAPGTHCVWMSQKVAASSTEGIWGEPIQIRGQDGANGESVTPRGEWVNNVSYNKGDIVKHKGYSYIAISNVPAGNAPDASIYSDIYIGGNQVTVNSGNALRVMHKGSGYWLIMTDYVDPVVVYTLESSVATVVFNSLGNPTPTAYSVLLKKPVDGINAVSDNLWLVTRYFDGTGWRRHGNAQLATSTSVTVRADAQQYETRVYAAQFDAEDWKDNFLAKNNVARADSGKDGVNGQDGTNGTNGSNGLTPEIRNGYWWIGNTNTGIKAEGIDGTNGITPHIGSNGNWWVGNQDTGIPATGAQGDRGPTGSMPRPCGFFAQGSTYMWDSKFQDWVIHPINGINYQFMVRTFGTTVTAAPTSAQGDSNWDVASKTKFVATDTALIDKANIAGFIYYNDYMISQWGKLNGVKKHVSELLTSADWAAFVPNIKLNGKIGEVIGAGGQFMVDQDGNIVAKSGTFGFMGISDSSIKSTNIELTNRALPSLQDMSQATDTHPVTTSTNSGSGNLNVEVSTSIANIYLSKPQVISLVANGECYSSDRNYRSIFSFAQVSVTDAQGINMGSQTVAHGATSEEDVFSRGASFTLPAGRYTVQLTGNANIMQADKAVTVTAKMTITSLRIEAISSTTLIGNNGFASHFASDKYIYFNSQEKIELRFGNYGLQLTETGLRKMTNGSSWVTL